jgi:hypothetical protein
MAGWVGKISWRLEYERGGGVVVGVFQGVCLTRLGCQLSAVNWLKCWGWVLLQCACAGLLGAECAECAE